MRLKIQKVIYLSSQENKDLLEAFFADKSELTGKSVTVLMEDHLLESIMPRNKKYWSIAENIILNKTSEAMGQTMDSLFSSLSAGINFKASHQNGRALVEFAYSNKLILAPGFNPIPDKQANRDVPYFYQELRYLSDRLNELAKEKDDYKIETDARDISEIYNTEKDQRSVYNDSVNRIYMAILSNWGDLGNWTYTFRLLCAITRIQTWYSSPETRLELLKIIDETTKEWD